MKLVLGLLLATFFYSCASRQQVAIQQQAFSENFDNNTGLNWYAENHSFENNLAYFDEQNAQVHQQQLILKLAKQHKNGKDYTGAEWRSKKMFHYGRFEAEIKTSSALGCITAFFLYRPKAEKNTEIDVEFSGKYPHVLTINNWVDHRSHDKDLELGFDSSKDFHRYVINWLPNKISWEVDGVTVYETKKAIPQKPMQVIFNLWVTKSEKWAGSIKSAKLPTFAYVKSFTYHPLKRR